MSFREIDYDTSIWHALAAKPYTIFLDGSERYSYILVNPKKIWRDWQTNFQDNINLEKHNDLPPFQGGIAGFLSYDLAHSFNPTKNLLNSPPSLICGYYDQLFAFDHKLQKAWKIWQDIEPQIPSPLKLGKMTFERFFTDFGKDKYIELVLDIKNRIKNGDAYQVNISEKFEVYGKFKSNDLYHKMRNICPAPFSCFANFDNFSILSASPERFIKIQDKNVITSPIKGTIARLDDIHLDQLNKIKLQGSKKDIAENVMIVDLMRSDFSEFCQFDSIKVEELCKLYSFTNVHHLISTISGKILHNKSVFDVLKSCMAAGSITGAPKAMSMDIISELEKKHRGAYCGHIFWTDGINLDSNILIRSMLVENDKLSFRVGGGITHLSEPESEYEEVLAKAKNLLEICNFD